MKFYIIYCYLETPESLLEEIAFFMQLFNLLLYNNIVIDQIEYTRVNKYLEILLEIFLLKKIQEEKK